MKLELTLHPYLTGSFEAWKDCTQHIEGEEFPFEQNWPRFTKGDPDRVIYLPITLQESKSNLLFALN